MFDLLVCVCFLWGLIFKCINSIISNKMAKRRKGFYKRYPDQLVKAMDDLRNALLDYYRNMVYGSGGSMSDFVSYYWGVIFYTRDIFRRALADGNYTYPYDVLQQWRNDESFRNHVNLIVEEKRFMYLMWKSERGLKNENTC